MAPGVIGALVDFLGLVEGFEAELDVVGVGGLGIFFDDLIEEGVISGGAGDALGALAHPLLHLVEEICTHLLILKRGEKVVHGTIAEVRRQFAELAPDATLEEVFFRATGGG